MFPQSKSDSDSNVTFAKFGMHFVPILYIDTNLLQLVCGNRNSDSESNVANAIAISLWNRILTLYVNGPLVRISHKMH